MCKERVNYFPRCSGWFFFNVNQDKAAYTLSDFTLKNLKIKAECKEDKFDMVENISLSNIVIE